jgi:hypothetical protein
MFGIDPITIGIGTLVWLAFKKQSGSQFGAMTAERQEIFSSAMAHCEDPQKLVSLSEAFRKEGLKPQAYALRKRAEWRGRTEAQKKEHADIFDRAMKSENANAILTVAAAFEDLTATVKAKQLRDRVQTLNELAVRKQAEAQAASEKLAAEKTAATAADKTKNGAEKPVIPGNTPEEKVAQA